MEKPENTIDAFRNSASLGADMLELDVWMTSDGVVVVSHDNNLLRVTGKDVNITDCPFDQLPNLQSTINTHFSE